LFALASQARLSSQGQTKKHSRSDRLFCFEAPPLGITER
jgi:hypothetical protein